MSLGPEGSRVAPAIDVQFDRANRRYAPGGPLAVRYRVAGLESAELRAVEVSVAWYTEGKGEEDLFVHAFERLTDRSQLLAALAGGTFATTLPPSPLSYEGIIVKIRWCVRIRVFFTGGRDYVSEHVFEVGRVPPARPLAGEATP